MAGAFTRARVSSFGAWPRRRCGMSNTSERNQLEALRGRAVGFLESLRHPILFDDGAEVFDLTAARWKFSIEFGLPLLEVWNPNPSLRIRVADVSFSHLVSQACSRRR